MEEFTGKRQKEIMKLQENILYFFIITEITEFNSNEILWTLKFTKEGIIQII
mgnify:CR=1 FL=1